LVLLSLRSTQGFWSVFSQYDRGSWGVGLGATWRARGVHARAVVRLVVGSKVGGGQRSAARMAKQLGIAREGRARRRAEYFF